MLLFSFKGHVSILLLKKTINIIIINIIILFIILGRNSLCNFPVSEFQNQFYFLIFISFVHFFKRAQQGFCFDSRRQVRVLSDKL